MSETKKPNIIFAKTMGLITAIMGIAGFASAKDVPINIESRTLDLSEEAIATLEGYFGKDRLGQMTEVINDEIKSFYETQPDLKAIDDSLKALLKEKGALTAELDGTTDRVEAKVLSDKIVALTAAHKKELDARDATIKKLVAESVDDVPDSIIKLQGGKFQHSATHLFGIADPYNAFDKRPWNARARDFGVKATDFLTDSNVPTIQGDLEHFVRENPDVINSWFNDMEDLPSQWSRRTGVIDRVASGSMAVGEIVQARKQAWHPKNKFKFDTEVRHTFRKQIDISFSGYQLQELETTWVGRIKNMDGSHPWKMNFIGFLLSEIAKQQRVDDRTAQINGIYSVDPLEKAPGRNVNSQNGLRYYWWYYRDVLKKFRASTIKDMPEPTPENIVDYMEQLILTIPEEYRDMPGLEIQCSKTILQWYRTKAGKIYQLHMNTDQGKAEYTLNHPIDRPNIIFQPLKDMTRTKFIGFVFSENVEVLDYNAAEKGKMSIVHDKRDTHIFADYRQGIGFIQVGMEAGNDDPATFQKQILWSNDQPIFEKDVRVPLFDDKSGKIKFNYLNMEIDENFNTDITDVASKSDLTAGLVVRIKGNTNAPAGKSIKKNNKFLLDSDFALNANEVLTLFVNEDLTLTEISRTNAVTGAPTDVAFEGTVIDATEGKVFRNENETAKTITSITGGVDGATIKIYGTDDANLTVADVADNIKVGADAVLSSSTHYLQLTFIDGIWVKTKLSNA